MKNYLQIDVFIFFKNVDVITTNWDYWESLLVSFLKDGTSLISN